MKFVALLSGGKDSCYNIQKCLSHGHELVCLANLCPPEDCKDEELNSFMYQSAAHSVVPLLAECFDKPLVRQGIRGGAVNRELHYHASEDKDEVEDLYALLFRVKELFPDVKGVSCGAIVSTYQRLRVENVCGRLNLVPLTYLWQRERNRLLPEMLSAGINATLVKVAGAGLDPHKHLGKTLGTMQPIFNRLHEKLGLDICGEGGEYESFVTDCNLFSDKRLSIKKTELIIDDEDPSVGNLKIIECCKEAKDSARVASAPPLVGGAKGQICEVSSSDARFIEDLYREVESGCWSERLKAQQEPELLASSSASELSLMEQQHNLSSSPSPAEDVLLLGCESSAPAPANTTTTTAAPPPPPHLVPATFAPLKIKLGNDQLGQTGMIWPKLSQDMNGVAAGIPQTYDDLKVELGSQMNDVLCSMASVLLQRGNNNINNRDRTTMGSNSSTTDTKEMMISAGLESAMHHIQQAAIRDSVYIHLYLDTSVSGSDFFSVVNRAYSSFFSVFPPSRCCVSVPLPRGVLVSADSFCMRNSYAMMRVDERLSRAVLAGVDATTAVNRRARAQQAADKLRKVLHVQSVSEWAPVSIGPYSQANAIGELLVMLAGQIAINPSTMNTIHASGARGDGSTMGIINLTIEQARRRLKAELLLSLRNAHRVLQAMNSSLHRAVSCTIFINMSSVEGSFLRSHPVMWTEIIDLAQLLLRSDCECCLSVKSATSSLNSSSMSECGVHAGKNGKYATVRFKQGTQRVDDPTCFTPIQLRPTEVAAVCYEEDEEEEVEEEEEEESWEESDQSDFESDKSHSNGNTRKEVVYPLTCVGVSSLPRNALIEVQVFAANTSPEAIPLKSFKTGSFVTSFVNGDKKCGTSTTSSSRSVDSNAISCQCTYSVANIQDWPLWKEASDVGYDSAFIPSIPVSARGPGVSRLLPVDSAAAVLPVIPAQTSSELEEKEKEKETFFSPLQLSSSAASKDGSVGRCHASYGYLSRCMAAGYIDFFSCSNECNQKIFSAVAMALGRCVETSRMKLKSLHSVRVHIASSALPATEGGGGGGGKERTSDGKKVVELSTILELERVFSRVLQDYCESSPLSYSSTLRDAPSRVVVVPVEALRPGCVMSVQFLCLDLQECETQKWIKERS